MATHLVRRISTPPLPSHMMTQVNMTRQLAIIQAKPGSKPSQGCQQGFSATTTRTGRPNPLIERSQGDVIFGNLGPQI